jgi:hypothetical protein
MNAVQSTALSNALFWVAVLVCMCVVGWCVLTPLPCWHWAMQCVCLMLCAVVVEMKDDMELCPFGWKSGRVGQKVCLRNRNRTSDRWMTIVFYSPPLYQLSYSELMFRVGHVAHQQACYVLLTPPFPFPPSPFAYSCTQTLILFHITMCHHKDNTRLNNMHTTIIQWISKFFLLIDSVPKILQPWQTKILPLQIAMWPQVNIIFSHAVQCNCWQGNILCQSLYSILLLPFSPIDIRFKVKYRSFLGKNIWRQQATHAKISMTR